jgi:hypothetical protein
MQHAVLAHLQLGLRTGHPVVDALLTSALFGILTYLASNLRAWWGALAARLSRRSLAGRKTSMLVVPMVHWAQGYNGMFSNMANLDYTALVWYLTTKVPVSRGEAIATRVIGVVPTILPHRLQRVAFEFDGQPMEYCRDYDEVKAENRTGGGSGGSCGALTTNERVELRVAVEEGVPLLVRFMQHVRSEKAASDSAVKWVQRMYRLVVGGKTVSWTAKPTHSTKTFDTVVLDADLKAELIADLRAFLGGEAWYASMGLAYKRGYLLHGPPGTGKSSVVLAIAGMAAADIYHLNLSLVRSDADLDDAFAAMPNKCVVVFEDIDCMGAKVTLARAAEPPPPPRAVEPKRKHGDSDDSDDEDARGSTLTLSCLLNHLDGSGTNHGRIFVMTTNHPERLDPALVRPGRTDVNLRLGLCSRQQIVAIFALFYPDHQKAPPARLAALPDNTLSPAEVSCTMLQFRNSPDLAVDRLHVMCSPS